MQTSSLIAKTFVNTYYNALAYNKEKLFQLYTADSVISFALNRDEVVTAEGRDDIAAAFSRLCLIGALTNLENGTVDSTGCGLEAITILVNGKMVREGFDEPNSFSQVFVLVKDARSMNGDRFYVKNDIIHMFSPVKECSVNPSEAAAIETSFGGKQEPMGEAESRSQQAEYVEMQESVKEPADEPVPQTQADECIGEQAMEQGNGQANEEYCVLEGEENVNASEQSNDIDATSEQPEPGYVGEAEQYEQATESYSEQVTGMDEQEPVSVETDQVAEPAPVTQSAPVNWAGLFPNAEKKPSRTYPHPYKQHDQRRTNEYPRDNHRPPRNQRGDDQSPTAPTHSPSGQPPPYNRHDLSFTQQSNEAAEEEQFTQVERKRSKLRSSKVDAPTLFIRFSSEEINEATLRDAFAGYGRIRDFSFVAARHMAYIQYMVPEHATSVLGTAKKHGIFACGERLFVDLKREGGANPIPRRSPRLM